MIAALSVVARPHFLGQSRVTSTLGVFLVRLSYPGPLNEYFYRRASNSQVYRWKSSGTATQNGYQLRRFGFPKFRSESTWLDLWSHP